MTKEPEDLGFRVTDKRAFREEGTPRQEPTAPKPEEAKDSKPLQNASGASTQPEPAPGTAFQINFPAYILSYYTQALMLLGEVPNPHTNKQEEDLEGAQHMVEILAMLQEKTKGNLNREEEQLLDSVLYELRMKFMAKTKRIKL